MKLFFCTTNVFYPSVIQIANFRIAQRLSFNLYEFLSVQSKFVCVCMCVGMWIKIFIPQTSRKKQDFYDSGLWVASKMLQLFSPNLNQIVLILIKFFCVRKYLYLPLLSLNALWQRFFLSQLFFVVLTLAQCSIPKFYVKISFN